MVANEKDIVATVDLACMEPATTTPTAGADDLETGIDTTAPSENRSATGDMMEAATDQGSPSPAQEQKEETAEATADALQDTTENNEDGCDLITTSAVLLVVDEEQPGTAPSSEGVQVDAAASGPAALGGSATAATTINATVSHHHDTVDDPLAASEHATLELAPTTRAEFVSVTVIKKNSEDRLGIAFSAAGRVGGNIGDEENINPAPHDMRILSLHADGMLHSSPLRVGDQLLSIAGKSCFELDVPTAGALLRQARGLVSIVVRNPTGRANYMETMVEKAEPTAPVGLAFRRNSYGSLEVSKVIATGLFAHSLLNVGDRVISINNVPLRPGLSAQEAVDMIRATPRFVTILTETHAASGVVVASAEHGEELAIAAAAAANAVVPKHETSLLHSCYCIWMIIISMSLIGLAVFQPFKRFREN